MATTLSTLMKRATIDDHEDVLRVCNAELKHGKGDLEILYIKLIALLKLERYDEAVWLLEEGGEILKRRAQLEHAYALYKNGEFEEAKKITNDLHANRGARHVEAQASYRLEEFRQAGEIYRDLSSTQAAIDSEENDLRINSTANDAQLEWKKQGQLARKQKPGRADLDAFETAYNAACGCIARGELGQGEILLKRAKDLCSSSDDLSNQEKTTELLSIGVQQLFVLNALGKIDQAKILAKEITLNDIPDLSTRQIAHINKLAASSTPTNPYLDHRLFHSTSTLTHTNELFEFQMDLTRRNRTILDLLTSKYTGVAKSTAKILSSCSSPTISAAINGVSVNNAAAHAHNQLAKLGLKEILPLLEKRPTDVGLVLTIVQLYALANNFGSAITIMESFLKRLENSKVEKDQDVRFAPGLVAVLISLYKSQGRKSNIKTELAKTASYWKHKSKGVITLMRAAGLSLLESLNPEDLKSAGEIFESLRNQDPSDRFAVAGYVAAYAMTDLSKVESEAEHLTPVNKLTTSIDIVTLEEAGVPQLRSIKTVTVGRKRTREDTSKGVRKRVRKSRLPKGYDPNKPADPERWFPLRDRSIYRPKGKKGKQKAALTQGGASGRGNDGLNMAGSDGVTKQANTVIVPASKAKKKKSKK